MGFAIHKVKFFFVEMSCSFLFNYLLILDQIIQSRSHYGVVYRFSNRSCLALSMTSITRPKEMIPKPAFRYYNSLLQRRQTAAAKVLYKMHTNHPQCRSSCYSFLDLVQRAVTSISVWILYHAISIGRQQVQTPSLTKSRVLSRNSGAQALFTYQVSPLLTKQSTNFSGEKGHK